MAYLFELNERLFLDRVWKRARRARRAAVGLSILSAFAGSAVAFAAPRPGPWTDARGPGPGSSPVVASPGSADRIPRDFVLGQWTWVSGSSAVVEQASQGEGGSVGPPGSGSSPGGRSRSVSWIDGGGSLWLFGGTGYGATGGAFGNLNDLWRWNAPTGPWSWVSGSNGTDQFGAYGIQGMGAPGNVPGARGASASWIDAGGNLWLFGGHGYAADSYGYLNDLWKWDFSAGVWSWVSGATDASEPGRYGTRGEPARQNAPGGRAGAASWADAGGNFWLFGGYVWADWGEGYRNDLWKWTPSIESWTWVGGSDQLSQTGTFGTRGEAAPGNVPGARSGSVSWVDAGGDLWLFGGEGVDSRVDPVW